MRLKCPFLTPYPNFATPNFNDQIRGPGVASLVAPMPSSRDSSGSEAGPASGDLDKLVIRMVLAANAVMDRRSNPF